MKTSPSLKMLPSRALAPLAATLLLAGLAGCGTLAPDYQRPAAPVAVQWPMAPEPAGPADNAAISWQSLFADAELRRIVQLALDNNRDLRVAALNIEKARAQYGIQRAALLPELNAGASNTSARTPAPVSSTGTSVVSHAYTADLGLSAWELDLFGRLRNLEDQALQQYLATEETHRAVRLSLIAEVSTAYMTLAAGNEQLALARSTLRSRQDAYALQRRLFDEGDATELTVRQAQSEMEAARDQALALESTVATDRNALELLAGTPLPADLRPAPLDSLLSMRNVPAGMPSDLLQRRPDILSAEHTLIGANANIGAARAAFFPRITLTGSFGLASDSLSSLFEGGNRAWSFAPQLTLPIFNGGRLAANLNMAKTDRDIAVANYERSIQSAFREVADTLAVRAKLDDRLSAQQRRVEALRRAYDLAQMRYDNGVSSYLEVLDAQRTLLAAQQNWIDTRLALQTNLVSLYKTTGGDWSAAASASMNTASLDAAPSSQADGAIPPAPK
jgi:multidrug efflux system outer membrane protein